MSQTLVHDPLAEGSESTGALLSAWQAHQQLQASAHTTWRWKTWQTAGLVISAIAATLLAICQSPAIAGSGSGWFTQMCRIALVLVGLAFISLVTALARSHHQDHWLIFTAGEAAVERAIYLYRTVLQCAAERDRWLNHQVAEIRQQVQERLGGLWVPPLAGLLGEEPPLHDLLADDYLQQRLCPQLVRTNRQMTQLAAVHRWVQVAIWVCAVLVVLLPFWGVIGLVGGAIAAVTALGLLLWLQMTQIDQRLKTHSQMVSGLILLRDRWQSLPIQERTGQKFFQLVMATESLLMTPHQQLTNYIRGVMDSFQEKASDLVDRTLADPVPIELEQVLRTTPRTKPTELAVNPEPPKALPAAPTDAREPAAEKATPLTNGKTTPLTVVASTSSSPDYVPAEKRGCPHAFVVMPFGRKQGPDGRWIDFNSIYQTLLKPAIEAAGFKSFRADEEASSGDIITDMFQELLLADLVVADLSIDNANVFYELGIRHAMRSRGVVHVQAGRAYMPFDIFNVRTLPYHCDDSGCPDPQWLEKDKQALVKMIQATWASERNRPHSPIFNLLTGLTEPDRKALRTPLARGYWQEYTLLQSRIAIAQRQQRIGDVMLLSEEVSNPLIKEEIVAEAGKALKNMGNSALALKQYRQGLKINPENVSFRCEEAYHLNRLGQSDEAIVKLEQLFQDEPNCVNATTYLARIYKDMWRQNWEHIEDETERIHAAYAASFLLQKSIESYLRGYRIDQDQYYAGVNALMLAALLDHLAILVDIDSGDAGEVTYRQMLPMLKGTIRFCLETASQKSPNDPWVALSIGDLMVCTAESPHHVAAAYRKALAALWNNKYAVKTSLEQLHLMQKLNFRPVQVEAGVAVLQSEINRFENQENGASSTVDDAENPSQIFLFAGHMLDQPNRSKPRFPAEMEHEATQRLQAALEKLGANSNCIAIAPGLACGGDLIFVEACLQRSMKINIYLPFEPAKFVRDSVSFAGDLWVERFYTALNHPNITLHLQPDRLGAVPLGDDPYERNNRWALYSTLVYDVRSVRLIVLWNGQGGDGPGGTADMVQQVRQLGGIVEHIDTTKFDYWQSKPATSSIVLPNAAVGG